MLREVRLYCHLLYTQTNQPHLRFTWNIAGILSYVFVLPVASRGNRFDKLRLKIQILLLYAGRVTGLSTYVYILSIFPY